MRITDLLKSESIVLGASPADKAAAINQLADLMEAGGNLSDKEQYKKDVFAREASGTTGLGDGIATPHAKSAGVKAVASIPELYKSCQYVSLHCPATKETIGSINYDLLKTMPKGACLINTARKEVIDEAGLEKALEDRPDLKYATDIAPSNYAALREKFGERVFATPKKMGAQTAEATLNAGLAAARQICAFFSDGCTKFQLNKF